LDARSEEVKGEQGDRHSPAFAGENEASSDEKYLEVNKGGGKDHQEVPLKDVISQIRVEVGSEQEQGIPKTAGFSCWEHHACHAVGNDDSQKDARYTESYDKVPPFSLQVPTWPLQVTHQA
jgi:hypothetical protein